MNFKITSHAYMRGKERMGWTAEQVQYYADASLTRGRWMMDKVLWRRKCAKYGQDCFAYKYRGAAFIFKDDRLITILSASNLTPETMNR